MDDTNTPVKTQRSWLDRLSHLLSGEPQDREELITWLRDAAARQVFDINALAMIEGVLQVSIMQVRDIMIPRPQMITLTEHAKLQEILPTIIQSNHSRFPVLNQTHDEVVGILLAKDLLRFQFQTDPVELSAFIRPVTFVPESKRLDVLLQDFRRDRQHMAIVIDEYGNIAGLVTIEDVLEQIVGDIDDEYDDNTDESFIRQHNNEQYIVKALTPIETFNAYFQDNISEEEFSTIGGLVTHALGHIPHRGETVQIHDYECTVLHADSRRVHLLQIQKLTPSPATTE